MKHRRGIELDPDKGTYRADPANTSFATMAEWMILGAYCPACHHFADLDRWELQRKYSINCPLASLQTRLRCVKCGNRQNRFTIKKAPR